MKLEKSFIFTPCNKTPDLIKLSHSEHQYKCICFVSMNQNIGFDWFQSLWSSCVCVYHIIKRYKYSTARSSKHLLQRSPSFTKIAIFYNNHCSKCPHFVIELLFTLRLSDNKGLLILNIHDSWNLGGVHNSPRRRAYIKFYLSKFLGFN